MPRPRRLFSPSERSIQRATVDMLALAGFPAVHVPNGAQLAGDKVARAKQAAALRKDGTAKGFPDLIVIGRDGRTGFIEMKSATGTLAPEQRWWRDELVRRGHCWALARSPEEALDALRAWGWR